MNPVETRLIQCPYCWETQEVDIDCSTGDQEYIEDCQICCNPICFQITLDNEGELEVSVSSEND